MADRDEELITGEFARARSAEGEETLAIRAEITETRERMGDTIEEIGERLNPRHLKQQVKEDVRDATIGRVENMAHNAADRVKEARRTIAETVRENPIPAALAGIGLGWLYLNSRKHDSHDQYGYGRSGEWRSGGAGYGREMSGGYSGRTTGYGAGYAERGYREGGRFGEREEEGKLEHLRERVSEAGHKVGERASELGHNVAEGASHLGERAQEVASDVAHNVAETTRRQAQRVEDRFYENPLMVGAASLALGLATGMAMPPTRTESKLMGGARDQFMNRVKETAEETTDKVKHVAERVADEAQDTAKEAAREEGLTG